MPHFRFHNLEVDDCGMRLILEHSSSCANTDKHGTVLAGMARITTYYVITPVFFEVGYGQLLQYESLRSSGQDSRRSFGVSTCGKFQLALIDACT